MTKPKTLAGKALWVMKNRPAEVLPSIRGYWLFWRTGFLLKLGVGSSEGRQIGRNVRIQRLRTLQCERPDARIQVGDHSIIYENARIGAYGCGQIEIGENSVLGDLKLACRHRITLGKRFLCSWNVFIQDFDPHPVDAVKRGRQVEAICASFRPGIALPLPKDETPWNFPGEAIVIGDDVWVGANCTILKGAEIGSGSIVATGSVVLSGKYPERSLLAGSPAKVVKQIEARH